MKPRSELAIKGVRYTPGLFGTLFSTLLVRMSFMVRSVCCLLLALCSLSAAGSGIEVDAWARATPPGGVSGAIYGSFRDTAGKDWQADEILFIKASHVMVHQTVMENDMMKMKHGDLRIPAGGSSNLAPGGTHIMLMGLTEPLIEGCRYSFSILWNDGDKTSHTFVTGGYGQRKAPETEGRLCP